MELQEYIKLMLKTIPPGTKVNFDLGIRIPTNGKNKGKIVVDDYSSNKVKFSVVVQKGENING